jgi:hypothetical protein
MVRHLVFFCLTQIVLDLEPLRHCAFGRAAPRGQSPAESKEQDRKCRERQADWRKVKESKGMAFEVLANNGNQQIRRSADLGYGTTDERSEGERHEIG